MFSVLFPIRKASSFIRIWKQHKVRRGVGKTAGAAAASTTLCQRSLREFRAALVYCFIFIIAYFQTYSAQEIFFQFNYKTNFLRFIFTIFFLVSHYTKNNTQNRKLLCWAAIRNWMQKKNAALKRTKKYTALLFCFVCTSVHTRQDWNETQFHFLV